MALKTSRSRHFSLPKDRLTLGVLVVLAVLAVVTAIVAFNVTRDLVSSWNLTNLPGVPVISQNRPTTAPGAPTAEATVAPPVGALQPDNGPAAQPWDGVSRVTILVLGLDARDWTTVDYTPGDPLHSDSMWLMTVDPLSKTAGMLSIPRDLWVNIPDHGYYKINQAYWFGDAEHLQGGGAALAVQTVEDFLGVPINYYAQIDFNAFVKFVDDIKGVKINIKEPITLKAIGSDVKVELKPGNVTLPGDLALAYARNRKDTYGDQANDFARSSRQRDVIMAIRDRILEFNMAPNLIANAPKIYKDLSSGIHTNLTLEQTIQLAMLVLKIPKENIRQGIIAPPDMVSPCDPPVCSTSLLKPIMDKIRILRDQIFTTGGPLSPAAVAGGDPTELMKSEAARISVRNGTLTPGLASRTGDYYKSQGMDVIDEITTDQTTTSMLIDYTGKPYTLAYLAKVMNIPSSRIYNRYDPNSQIDVAVVLGNDWANKNPMP
jgi:polyisoprenyl-teichoic acid--peptidoglycan teichoic acid transferase